jgi:hypothetical protein
MDVICIENSKYIKEITELIKIKKKPNEKIITMCGYRCDLCKAFAGNIKKNDQRQQLSEMWKKYYNLEIAAEDIYCDGCRCIKKGAKRIDGGCPVRECVINNAINSCADCNKYPCSLFEQHEGLCFEKAQMMKGDSFCEKEYYEFILAYDNKSRLEGLIKFNHTK